MWSPSSTKRCRLSKEEWGELETTTKESYVFALAAAAVAGRGKAAASGDVRFSLPAISVSSSSPASSSSSRAELDPASSSSPSPSSLPAPPRRLPSSSSSSSSPPAASSSSSSPPAPSSSSSSSPSPSPSSSSSSSSSSPPLPPASLLASSPPVTLLASSRSERLRRPRSTRCRRRRRPRRPRRRRRRTRRATARGGVELGVRLGEPLVHPRPRALRALLDRGAREAALAARADHNVLGAVHVQHPVRALVDLGLQPVAQLAPLERLALAVGRVPVLDVARQKRAQVAVKEVDRRLLAQVLVNVAGDGMRGPLLRHLGHALEHALDEADAKLLGVVEELDLHAERVLADVGLARGHVHAREQRRPLEARLLRVVRRLETGSRTASTRACPPTTSACTRSSASAR